MGRLEVLFVWYGWTMALLLLLCGQEVPGRWWWLAGHVALFLPFWLLSRRGKPWLCYLCAVVTLPLIFTTLGLFIADLVPEPFEWRVMEWNRLVAGEALQGWFEDPPAFLVEACQVCYSTYYFLPLGLGFSLAARRKWRAFEHLAVLVIGGFLLSYLGYVCMPTLPPYRFLSYPAELRGGPCFRFLNPLLYEAEALRQDCMPSGHTMMTLLVCLLAWRYDRRQLLWLGPISFFLILGTILLRYHWFVDLVAAVPFLLLALLLFPARRTKLSRERFREKAGAGSIG